MTKLNSFRCYRDNAGTSADQTSAAFVVLYISFNNNELKNITYLWDY